MATFGGGVASTQDFIAIAQRDSGQDLREFFRVWLYTPGQAERVVLLLPDRARHRRADRRRVPATLALTLGTAAPFGAFTPGVAKDYLATTTANVISTAGDAALSIADSSPTNAGHLVNGTFSLPQAVQARARARRSRTSAPQPPR